MIPATSNYQTALAAFNAGKIGYLIQIENYSRAFSNVERIGTVAMGPIGKIERWISISLGGWTTPGSLQYSGFTGLYAAPGSDNPSAPSRSLITDVVVAMSYVNTPDPSGYQPAWNVQLSVDGGTTWGLLGLLPGTAGLNSVAYDISSQIAAAGGVAGFDFSKVMIQVFPNSTLFVTVSPPGATLEIQTASLDFSYSSGSPTTASASIAGIDPDPSPPSPPFGAISIPSATIPVATIYPWMVSIDDLSQTVQDLDGGADTTNLCFTVQDFENLITADFPGFTFEGARVTLKTFFVSLGFVDYCTIWTGFIDSVASANSNLEYYFSCLDTFTKLNQVIYQKADNGGITSGQNLRTVQDNPMNILLDILQNQLTNPDGSVGLDPSLIDTATIEAYRDGPFAGLEFLFHVNQPPNAGDFIKSQLLKPLGGWIFINALGQVSVAFFYPLEGAVPLMTLGPGNWTSIPEAEQTDMVNTVEFQFDKDDADANASGNYDSDLVEEYQPSIAKYGIFGEQVIQADGLRSAFLGYFIATFVAWMTFFRYGFKNLKFDQYAAESLWGTMRLESGDVVDVTHPNIPDRTVGVMGITNKPFQILDKKWNFTEGRVTLTMIDASYLAKFGFFEIAPNAEADYTAASSADQGKYLFMTSNGVYSNGNPGNVLG